jgi:thiol-disulfide isomerase/thioredoxin
MICVACLTELLPTSPEAPCTSCGADPRLAGRYALLARVGRGAHGVVYRATDLRSGDTVAVKQVLLGNLDSDKARALVAREGDVLRQLRHPALPRWRDELLIGRGRAATAYLVQDFVEGTDLQAGLAEHRWSEAEALDLIDEVLDVLVYLHGLHPPVVHRDLKPANLIRRSDGRVALVDFGAVREALSDTPGGATVAGTFGFMAPEAFGGAAPPTSDVYSLGMTVVALLSRRPPAELHGRDGHVAWRSAVGLSPGLMGLLDAMLQPEPDRRPSAVDARRRVGALRVDGNGAPTPSDWSPAVPVVGAAPGSAEHRPPAEAVLAPLPPPALPDRGARGGALKAGAPPGSGAAVGIGVDYRASLKAVSAIAVVVVLFLGVAMNAATPPSRRPASATGVAELLVPSVRAGDEQPLPESTGAATPSTGAAEAAAVAAYAEIDRLMKAGAYKAASAKVPAFLRAHHATETSVTNKRTLDELSLVGTRVDPQWATKVNQWYQGEGKVDLSKGATLVVFWEEWCPHCQKELPKLVELAKQHQPSGLRLLGLTRVTKSSTDEAVRAYVSGQGFDFPVAKEREGGPLSAAFLVKGIPAAALVVDGEVAWRGHPARLHDQHLMDKLLGVYSPPTGAQEAAAGVAFAEIDELMRAGDLSAAAAKVPAFRQAHEATETYAAKRRILEELSLVGTRVDPQWAVNVEQWYQGEDKVDLSKGATLVVFWEEWCPYSRKELPRLFALVKQHQPDGLRMLGLTRVTKSATDDTVRAFLVGEGIDVPMAKEHAGGPLSAAFLVKGIPAAALVIDGQVAWRGHPGKLNDALLAALWVR